MSIAILLLVAASSSPRGVLAFAPPAPTRLAAATSLAMSVRNELYPGPSNYYDDDDREWTDWDDAAPFDAPPPRDPRPSSAGDYPPTQPRSASSASGAGERPFSRSNDRYWSSGQYSQPIDTRPQSAWQTDAQKEYRASKFQREGQWPQKQVYRGYNKPSADGPVGSRSSFGAGYGGNQRREERLDRMGNGMGVPTSGLPASDAGRTRRDNEGYNDVGRAQKGRTEDFRSRASSRTSTTSPDKLPTLRGEEVGFGRRDSSFDGTAAATRGTGFGDESDYLDRMREDQRRLQRRLQREEGWERQSRGRRMGTANIDDGDSFNERGESRGMLEDLSGPRGYAPPPVVPPPRAPLPLPPPPLSERRQGRRGASVGEGYTPAFRRGSKSGGYSSAPKYGDRLAGGSATQGWPPKREVYETDLRPGDYGRRMEGGPPPSLTEMAGRDPPPPLPREGDLGRFASGAGYQYYGDGTQPPAKPRIPQAELNEFGREAGGRFYQYYGREAPPSQRGMNDRPESATKPRYMQPRPPPTQEFEEFRDDFEDADNYSRGRRGTEPGSTSYDEARPRMRDGVDEGWRTFDQRSSQKRADGAFDRRRWTSQTSFGDARSDSGERRPTEPPSFGRKRLEQDSFVERYEDGEKMLEENWSSQQRADRSFERRRMRSQQSFGQRPPPPRFGDEVGGFEENVSSQQRADRSFDQRRAASQQSFGDARDDDFEQRRAPRQEEKPWEEPYQSKLLSQVQQYPPARRAGGSGGKEKATSGQNLVDGIKKMADKILSPYAEDGSAFAVDRMMNRVQTDIDKSIADEKRTMKALLADARSCLLADPTVRDMLGGAVRLGKPLSKSASSTMVNDVTKSRLQLVLPIFGSEGEGLLRLEANQDEIERLELEAEGRVIDVRLGRPGDAVDVDVYTFPNSEGQ